MRKSLEQLQSHQAHYLEISPFVKIEGKKVLRQHLKKLNAKIRRLQEYSATVK